MKVITKHRKQKLSHPTAEVYILSSKGKSFNTICSAYHTDSVIRNMKWCLSDAQSKPTLYDFIDLDSAVIVVKTDLPPIEGMTDNELLAALGA